MSDQVQHHEDVSRIELSIIP